MVPYLRAANVKDGRLDLSDVKEMDFTLAEQATFALRPGDVLVTEGAGSLAAVGASAVWSGEIDGTVCFQNTLLRLRPAGGTYPRFVMWWARYAYGSGLFATVAGGANIFHLGTETVRTLPATVPSPPRQRAIANYLDAETARIDAVVASRQRQLSFLRLRVEAARESWLQRLVLNHGTVPLKRVANRIEQGWSPECDAVAAQPDEWGVLKTSAVSSGTFDALENKRLSDGLRVDSRWVVRDGDLLVVRGSGSPAAVGQAAVASVNDRHLLLADLLYRVRLTRGNTRFFAHVLCSPYARSQFEQAIRTDVGMTRKIRTEDLANLLVPAVPDRLQAGLADDIEGRLGAIESAANTSRRQIDLLLERRQALITAAVTGQIDIPGIAA